MWEDVVEEVADGEGCMVAERVVNCDDDVEGEPEAEVDAIAVAVEDTYGVFDGETDVDEDTVWLNVVVGDATLDSVPDNVDNGLGEGSSDDVTDNVPELVELDDV